MSDAGFQCAECNRHSCQNEPGYIESGGVVCRDCRDALHPACPSCGVVMQRKLPKSHGKCPDCGEPFYVRRNQWVYNTTLLSAEQRDSLRTLDAAISIAEEYGVTKADAERAIAEARQGGRSAGDVERGLRQLAATRVTDGCPDQHRVLGTDGVFAALDAQRILCHYLITNPASTPVGTLAEVLAVAKDQAEGWKRVPAAEDVAWECFNRGFVRTKDPHALRNLYLAASMFLAESGRQYAHVAKKAFQLDARQSKELHVRRMTVMPMSECSASQRAAERPYTVDHVIEDPPIPCTDCSAEPLVEGGPPWCRCTMQGVPE